MNLGGQAAGTGSHVGEPVLVDGVMLLEVPGGPVLAVSPTPSMLEGTQRVYQHSWCGAVVVSPDGLPPGPCPCCDHHTHGWWGADLPVAGLEVVA